MKTAREVAEKEHGSCDAADHDACCVECLTAIIEQARREGAEWMREQAADVAMARWDKCATSIAADVREVGHYDLRASDAVEIAEAIRALPVTP